MRTKLKLYGERHTNTNYLSKLIEMNLDCSLIEGVVPTTIRTLENIAGRQWLRDLYFRRTRHKNFGWKHSAVSEDLSTSGVYFLTLTKNPYAWLVSMHRRPYHQDYKLDTSLEQFLTLPWHTVGRENLTGPVENPVQLWNIKNRSYLNLADASTQHLTTESTFIDPAAVIDQISTRFDIPKLHTDFVDFKDSTKKRPDQDGDYYRDYYCNERWRSDLSSQAIQLINKELDRELMTYFGYLLL